MQSTWSLDRTIRRNAVAIFETGIFGGQYSCQNRLNISPYCSVREENFPFEMDHVQPFYFSEFWNYFIVFLGEAPK